MAIRATPSALLHPFLGATTPTRWNRLWATAAVSVTTLTGVLPSSLDKSAREGAPSLTVTVLAGARKGLTVNFRSQNTTLAASKAQTANAVIRADIGRL